MFNDLHNLDIKCVASKAKRSRACHLRAAVYKYREFAVKTEISKSFIFVKKKPFGETFLKITIKVSKEFSFSRKPAKSEMLPHAI